MMETTCNTHNTCFTPSIMLIYNKHAYINIIFSHNLNVIQTSNNTQKLDFNLQTQKTVRTVHNQDHPTQIPNYSTTISSRTAVLKTTQTHKSVLINNNFYRNYSLNQPTTRANRHGHFMALQQRLTRVGENPTSRIANPFTTATPLFVNQRTAGSLSFPLSFFFLFFFFFSFLLLFSFSLFLSSFHRTNCFRWRILI